jgi:phage shock protein E
MQRILFSPASNWNWPAIAGLFLFAALLFTSSLAWSQMTDKDIRDITPEEAWQKYRQGAIFLDVRSPEEFERGHFLGSKNIPHDQLLNRLAELEEYRDNEIVLFCASGRRSDYSKGLLYNKGFKNLSNAGGVNTLIRHKPQGL